MLNKEPDRLFCLRPGLAVIPMSDGIQLRAGDEEIHVLRGDDPELLQSVLLLLERPQSRQSLMHTLGSERAAIVDDVLHTLADARLLMDAAAPADEATRYWVQAALHSPHVQPPPADAHVAVLGNGGLADLLADMVQEHGLNVSRYQQPSELRPEDAVIACTWEQPDLGFLLEVNSLAIRNRTACLFMDLSHGRHGTLGPFFVPGEGSCYECFRQRWRQNSEALPEMDAAHAWMLRQHAPLPAFGTLPAFRHWLAGMGAAELLAYFVRHRPLRTLNRALTIDVEEMSTWAEPVWRIPWCAACGILFRCQPEVD